MDADRFDTLTRAVTAPLSRRVTLRGLATGVLLALGPALDEAPVRARRRKRKNRPNCRGDRLIRCGSNCCSLFGETCRNGRCVDHCQDGEKNFDETDKDCGGSCRDVRKCGFLDECDDDADCFNDVCEPFLGARRCAQCRIDSDCDRLNDPLKFRCLINRICVECAADFDCPRPGQDATQTLCVAPGFCQACRTDADCPRPGQPAKQKFCIEPVAGGCQFQTPCLCRECRTGADCAEGELCDEEGRCLACPGAQRGGRVRAEDCPVGCVETDDCPGFPDGPLICCGTGEERRCVDRNTDDENCGFCGNSCTELGEGVECCDRQCRNLLIDGFNCGACDNRCPDPCAIAFGCCDGACGFAGSDGTCCCPGDPRPACQV